MFYLGIDYHKAYSVVHALDDTGQTVLQSRVPGNDRRLFEALFLRLPGPCRVVWEAGMNGCTLYDLLQPIANIQEVTLAHPYKTRIIAEAQVKTGRIDARRLAVLLRGDLICKAHISSPQARRQKDILRQRTFFVRLRTRLRNRVHRLLGAQMDLALPALTGLFGKRGMAYLRQLHLPAPADALLRQNLDQLIALEGTIQELEARVKQELAGDPIQQRLESLPGVGPILSAVITHEVDGVRRFISPQRLCAQAGLAPGTDRSGGRTHSGRLMRQCNKWLRWAYVEAAWVAIGWDPYFPRVLQCPTSARQAGQHRHPHRGPAAVPDPLSMADPRARLGETKFFPDGSACGTGCMTLLEIRAVGQIGESGIESMIMECHRSPVSTAEKCDHASPTDRRKE